MSYIKAYMPEPKAVDMTFAEMIEAMRKEGWTIERDMDKQYAKMSWSYCDVQQLRPDYSREEAEDVLDKLEDDIADAMLQAGWDILQQDIGDVYSQIREGKTTVKGKECYASRKPKISKEKQGRVEEKP